MTCITQDAKGNRTLLGSDRMLPVPDAGACDYCGGKANGVTNHIIPLCYQCWALQNLRTWLPCLTAAEHLRFMDEVGIPRTFSSTAPAPVVRRTPYECRRNKSSRSGDDRLRRG